MSVFCKGAKGASEEGEGVLRGAAHEVLCGDSLLAFELDLEEAEGLFFACDDEVLVAVDQDVGGVSVLICGDPTT